MAKRRKKNKLKPYFADCENWRSLTKGTEVKVLQGSGSFYLGKSGEAIPMSESGRLVVDAIAPDGLHCYNEYNSHIFVYMGVEKVAATGTILKPHKIKVLVRPAAQ